MEQTILTELVKGGLLFVAIGVMIWYLYQQNQKQGSYFYDKSIAQEKKIEELNSKVEAYYKTDRAEALHVLDQTNQALNSNTKAMEVFTSRLDKLFHLPV
jgi:hypothetical protein